MTAEYPVSIIVPTRNRAACLMSLLDTLERYYADGHRFQLIIADNSDDDALRARVEASPIPVDYRYSSEVLSVVENFNCTVPLIRGEYACFMGDDDIVSTRLFELVSLMKAERIDAANIAPALKCLYFWPGVSHVRWGEVGGRLYMSRPTGAIKSIDMASAKQASRLRISDGPQALPRAYFGVVSADCIARVTQRYGSLFGGVSPDIFSSRLLSEIVTKCVSVDLPFIAPGAGKSSTSAGRAERSDVGKLRDNDHTGRFKDLAWDPRVPAFYAPFTVWAQSLIQAENLIGSKLSPWAFAYLYAKCTLFARGHFSSIREAIGAQPQPLMMAIRTLLSMGFVAGAYLIEKLPLLLRRAPGGADDCYENLASSDAATQLLNKQIATIPLRYGDASH
jgi:glycosyltransferase involved in cell wall biosynthesis